MPTFPHDDYICDRHVLNARWLGQEQDRSRSFVHGRRWCAKVRPLRIETLALEPAAYARTVTSSHAGGRPRMKGRIESLSVEEALRRQGCPPEFFGPDSPFKRQKQLKMIAQGVPLPMGRAVARAVRAALAEQAA